MKSRRAQINEYATGTLLTLHKPIAPLPPPIESATPQPEPPQAVQHTDPQAMPELPAKRFVAIEGVEVRTVCLNPQDANNAAGVFFVGDPRLSGYRVAGNGKAHTRLWLEPNP